MLPPLLRKASRRLPVISRKWATAPGPEGGLRWPKATGATPGRAFDKGWEVFSRAGHETVLLHI